MFCKTCGNLLPDGAGFCTNCGAVVAPPAPGYGPWGEAGYGGYGAPGGPPKKSRLGLWLGIVAAVIVIAAGVTVPLLLLGGDDDNTVSSTTGVSKTTTTTRLGTSSSTTPASSSSTSSTSSSSATTSTTSAPGDSAGEWIEATLPNTPEGAYSVVVSDQALLVETNSDSGFGLYACLLGSDSYLALPFEGTVSPQADLDGLLAVWREGTEDQETYEFVDTSICAYPLPGGAKIEVQKGARAVDYPQVAGRWVSWTEQTPSEFNPEEYLDQHIYVVEVDAKGKAVSAPDELVSSAPSDALGDSAWVYSLSSDYLAWENAVGHHLLDAGAYVVGVTSESMPQKLGNEAWEPSIGGTTVAYWDGTLRATDIVSRRAWEIDPLGDFPAAAPTYTAYYRIVETADQVSWQIVARGHSGANQQVLAETSLDPYLSAPIAAAGAHVAFLLDGEVHLFEWRGAGRLPNNEATAAKAR